MGSGKTTISFQTTVSGYHHYEFENCSDVLPFSEDVFSAIPLIQLVPVAIATVLTLATIAVFLESSWFVLRRYLNHKTKILSLWMMGIHPVFAMTSIIAVCIPRSAMFSDLISALYLAMCLRMFLVLLIHYHGGTKSLITRMKDDHLDLRSPPVCCCCCCCPKIKISRKNLTCIKICVWQVAFLRPFIVFISAVLWADGKYITGKVAVDQAYVYLTVPTILSTFLAMYGLQLIYRASVKHLGDYHIIPKFASMQLTLVFSNIQRLIFTILAANDWPKCKGIMSSNVRGDALHHLILIGEMFLLALLARCYYRRIDGVQTIAEIIVEVSESVEDNSVASVTSDKHPDVVRSDAFHVMV